MPLEDNNWIPAAVVGGSLVLLGVGMIIRHVRSWKVQQQDETLSDFDWQHLRSRYFRRMRASALIVLAGCLVGLGDRFIWQCGPVVSVAYWAIVVLLMFWIAILALGDLASVQTHSQTTISQIQPKRKELEAELEEYRRRSNGRPIKE